MKNLGIVFAHYVQTHYIADDAVADKAYETINAALVQYREYTNDESKTVTVDTGDDCRATYRIGCIAGVTLANLHRAEDGIVSREIWGAKLKARIKAATETKD